MSDDELKVIRESFVGYYADEADCRETVKRVYEKENRLIDTHTAVAVSSAERYMNDNKAKNKVLVVSTASPYKFAGDVLLSITGSKPKDDLDAPSVLNALTDVEIPSPLKRILDKSPIHSDVIDKENMPDAVLDFVLN